MSIRYLRNLTAVPSLSGNNGKFLTNDGIATSWAPISKTNNLAGGGTNQIPFQSSTDTTAFSSNFTFDAARGTLSVYNGGTGTVATLVLGTNTYGEHRITTGVDGVGSTQSLRIQPHRQEMGTGLRAGKITISGGDVSGSFGLAGGVDIIGGGTNSTATGSGLYGANGPINITGGPGSGDYPSGGSVTISGGTGNYSAGGVIINGGTGSNGGGSISISTAPTSSLVQRLKILANGAWSIGADDTSYGVSGQVLTSNGNAAPSWQSVSALPSQTGNSGKYLTTDGTNASWTTVSSTLSGIVAFAAGYNEPISAVSATASTTIDCSLGNNFDISLSASITSLSFINVPANRRLYPCTLILIQDAIGGRTVSWPASFKWSGKVAPTLTSTAGGIDIITMVTYDGGTTWLATVAGQNF